MSDTIWANCPICGVRNYWGHSWISVHGWTCAECVKAGPAGQQRRHQEWQQRLRADEQKKEEERQRVVRQAQEAARHAEAARRAAEQRVKDGQKEALRNEIRQIDSNINDVERELRRVMSALEEKCWELEAIQQQMAVEQSKLIDFSEERRDSRIKTVVLLGMTGEGKSTFGNRLSGDLSEEANSRDAPFGTSIRSDSETQRISKHISSLRGERLCIVDTPGLEDSYGRDREHVNNLISWLRGCGGINQFFLVKMAGNPRFHQNFRQMLARMEGYLGADFWNFVTIVLTKIEGRDVEKFEQYREDLAGAIQHEFHCGRINVVGIGFDDFQESVQGIVASIPNEKFQCEHLRSPVDELQEKATILENEVEVAREGVSIVEQRFEKLVADKTSAEDRLRKFV